jgi:hypothetical protein
MGLFQFFTMDKDLFFWGFTANNAIKHIALLFSLSAFFGGAFFPAYP